MFLQRNMGVGTSGTGEGARKLGSHYADSPTSPGKNLFCFELLTPWRIVSFFEFCDWKEKDISAKIFLELRAMSPLFLCLYANKRTYKNVHTNIGVGLVWVGAYKDLGTKEWMYKMSAWGNAKPRNVKKNDVSINAIWKIAEKGMTWRKAIQRFAPFCLNWALFY